MLGEHTPYGFNYFKFVEICFVAQDTAHLVLCSVSAGKQLARCCCWWSVLGASTSVTLNLRFPVPYCPSLWNCLFCTFPRSGTTQCGTFCIGLFHSACVRASPPACRSLAPTHGWKISCCRNGPHLVSPLADDIWIVSIFGCCQECCFEHGGTFFCVDISFSIPSGLH